MSERPAAQAFRALMIQGGQDHIPTWLEEVTRDYKTPVYDFTDDKPKPLYHDEHIGILEIGRNRRWISLRSLLDIRTAIAWRDQEIEHLRDVVKSQQETVRAWLHR